MKEKDLVKNKIPQMSWVGLAAFILVPLGWWVLLLYIITPWLLPWITTPMGEINGYALNWITLSGYIVEFLLALAVLRREGRPLDWCALRSRLALRWGGLRSWVVFVGLFALAFTLTIP